MAKFIVKHSDPLHGTVTINGAKNAALPILAACLLTEEECDIWDVAPLKDVEAMLGILESLGAKVSYHREEQKVSVQAGKIRKFQGDPELAIKMRASFLIMGPLLARLGKARIPYPGGCQIGSRPVDLHLKGFAALGARIKQEYGYIDIRAKSLIGTKIYLDFPSVGATENIMMAAVKAQGETVIENAAAEPEICDLAAFLVKMGAKIEGAGTDTIHIEGVERLSGAGHKVIPDRIEAGTFMVAAAITKGDIYIENVIPEHLTPIIAKLAEAHVKSEMTEKGLHVYTEGKIVPIHLKTMPFPGFPTDLQAPFMSLMTVADGTSIVTETVFENRFMHAGEMQRMGADIKIDSRTAVVEGVKKLTGTQVKATDLRAGAALILSALAAEGDTEISDIYHVERGYYKIEEKLKNLGAEIEKVEDESS